MTGIVIMDICAAVKSSWGFVCLQAGHFHSHLGDKTWLGEGGSVWCHGFSGAELSSVCPTALGLCVQGCPPCLQLPGHQGPCLWPHPSSSSSLGPSQCAKVPRGFRSPLAGGVPGAVWILGCPAPAAGTAGLVQAVTLLFLQERHFRGCWENYWSPSVSLTCLAPVMRF